MPQKSIEQYERELMEMYRLALAKNPDYAALARRHSSAAVQETPIREIDVPIPAPGVEEAVPLPRGVIPVPVEEAPTPASPIEMPPAGEVPAPAFPTEMSAAEEIDWIAESQPAALPIEAAEPPVIAVVLPVPARTPTDNTGTRVSAGTPAETQTVVELDIDDDPDIVPEVDFIIEAEPGTEIATVGTGVQSSTQSGTGTAAPDSNRAVTPPASEGSQRMAAVPNLGAGNLIVNVTTQSRTKPVVGAVVTVNHPDESGNRMAARAVTDSSGKTELIRLPAPIREIPVYPQPMTGGDLSAKYIVNVQAPGFEEVSGEEVSIFDGVTSVKRVDLIAEPGGRRTEGNTAESRGAAQGE